MSFTICFIVALAVLMVFLFYGIMHVSNVDSYFNCGRQLRWFEFGNSFAAASTSLATVLFFFVTLGQVNGLYILFSPISFLAGTFFFNRCMLPRIERQDFLTASASGNTLGGTLGEYIKRRYNSQLVKYVVLAITLLGILSVMLIELYVGVQIFDIFLKPEYEEYALYFIALITFVYTGLGGLNAVVKTDKIQYWFMAATATAIILYLYFSFDNTLTPANFFPPLLSADGVLTTNWALYLNMLCVNILLVPSLLRNWQLLYAAKDSDEIKRGFWNGVALTVFVSLLFVVFGMLFFNIFDGATPSMNGILLTLANTSSPILSYVFFPLLFASCLMALLSTVDSSILPIVQCLAEDIFPHSKKETRKKMYAIYIIVTLAFSIFLYSVVFKYLKFDIISWLFTIFSLVTISAPAILFGCFGKNEILRTRLMQYVIALSTVLGLCIALGISLYGNNMDGVKNIGLIQLNTPIAVIVSSVIDYIVYKCISVGQSHANR